ncbi:MAG: hypothetical protein ABI641_09625 [Caldimonas sp.]
MNRSSTVVVRALLAASLCVMGQVAVQAQPRLKSPPRLAPNPAQSSHIPAGVDTGTPATTDALPLGTPVPPAAGVARGDLRLRSAAARAAARPKPAASAASAAVVADSVVVGDCVADAPAFNRSMAECTAMTDRAKRSECASRLMEARRAAGGGKPVALPGTGFVGSSAGPSTAAALGSRRAGCGG